MSKLLMLAACLLQVVTRQGSFEIAFQNLEDVQVVSQGAVCLLYKTELKVVELPKPLTCQEHSFQLQLKHFAMVSLFTILAQVSTPNMDVVSQDTRQYKC
mmetsp:Transcript_10477/g.13597  ORF Transcript_10477/g.13597 Transcript_10477/m.13597 type:complete len:100 (-) Transcript_10477:516-815(-)